MSLNTFNNALKDSRNNSKITKASPNTASAVAKKPRKKKTSRACANCQKAHLTCDDGRPCQRCLKKGLTNCVDGFRKQAKYLMDIPPEKLNPPANVNIDAATNSNTNGTSVPNNNKNEIIHYTSMIIPNSLKPNINFSNNDTFRNEYSSASPSSFGRDMKSPQSPPPGIQPIIAFPPFDFSSKAVDLEYSSITSLLESDMALPSITDNLSGDHMSSLSSHMQPFFQDPNNSIDFRNNNNSIIPLQVFSQHPSPAQSNDGNNSSNRCIHQINKTPEEVYKNVEAPFPYTQGYHTLLLYLRRRFNSQTLMVLARSMAEYRPSFIATTKTLQEEDLIFMEKCFQRTLLEFNKFILCSGTPTVVWRRTGQIAAAGQEFCLLTGWRLEQLVKTDPTKAKFIMELMDDTSVTKYFDVFTRLAFGDSRGVIMTDCTLLKPDGQSVKTACTWTVKRDVFDIPMMIIGNFLPILE